MVESGPFIEYCRELYIHHSLLNSVIAAVMLLAVSLILGAFALGFYIGRCRLKSRFSKSSA